ncbi:MAG: CpaF family protein [Desulfurellaceae bacterium]|nr:CpaF family protein [Desulfurellaceae bacterium]
MPRNLFGRRPKAKPQQPAPEAKPQHTAATPTTTQRREPAASAVVAEVAEPVSLARRQTSDGLVADMAAKIHPTVVQSLDMSKAASLDRDQLAVQLRAFLDSEDSVAADLTPLDRQRVVQRLVDDIKGLGPLEPLFNDPQISDILVNGLKSVYVERRGKLEQVDVRFRDEQHLLNIAQRIAGWVGRRVDEASPMVDARLPDGSRVNIIIPPLAIDGATFSIRRFIARGISLEDLAAYHAITPEMARLLQICAQSRLNVLVSGGTGAGKTTFLNALSREINNTERLVTIEDSAELQLQQPHVVRLETRTKSAEGTGEMTIRDLLINALRMRPDRIIVGEVRGGEVNEMLQAMNTGHPGSMCTIHANNPRDALMRLENMLMLASGDMPLTAIDLVVQLAQLRSGHRCVTSITDVAGMEGDIVTTEEMWRRLPGEAHVFESTGRQPSWMSAVDAAGLRAELIEVLQMSGKKDVEAAA